MKVKLKSEGNNVKEEKIKNNKTEIKMQICKKVKKKKREKNNNFQLKFVGK